LLITKTIEGKVTGYGLKKRATRYQGAGAALQMPGKAELQIPPNIANAAKQSNGAAGIDFAC